MTIVLGILVALAALVGLGGLIALPAIAIAHFGKTYYVPAGVTAHEVDRTTISIFDNEFGNEWQHYSINDFLSTQQPLSENPVQREIKEQERRLGRKE